MSGREDITKAIINSAVKDRATLISRIFDTLREAQGQATRFGLPLTSTPLSGINASKTRNRDGRSPCTSFTNATYDFLG